MKKVFVECPEWFAQNLTQLLEVVRSIEETPVAQTVLFVASSPDGMPTMCFLRDSILKKEEGRDALQNCHHNLMLGVLEKIVANEPESEFASVFREMGLDSNVMFAKNVASGLAKLDQFNAEQRDEN